MYIAGYIFPQSKALGKSRSNFSAAIHGLLFPPFQGFTPLLGIQDFRCGVIAREIGATFPASCPAVEGDRGGFFQEGLWQWQPKWSHLKSPLPRFSTSCCQWLPKNEQLHKREEDESNLRKWKLWSKYNLEPLPCHLHRAASQA